MANGNMKRFSTPLIGEMQIKISVRYHLTPVRTTIIKKSKDNCWQGGEKKEHCTLLVEM